MEETATEMLSALDKSMEVELFRPLLIEDPGMLDDREYMELDEIPGEDFGAPDIGEATEDGLASVEDELENDVLIAPGPEASMLDRPVTIDADEITPDGVDAALVPGMAELLPGTEKGVDETVEGGELSGTVLLSFGTVVEASDGDGGSEEDPT